MTAGRAAEQRSLLEIEALLAEIRLLRDDGDAERFATDHHYRWILHRLWIAVGNEALAYTNAHGIPVRKQAVWANLYDLRNHLAHTPAGHRRRPRPALHLDAHRLVTGHRERPASTQFLTGAVSAWALSTLAFECLRRHDAGVDSPLADTLARNPHPTQSERTGGSPTGFPQDHG